MSALSSRSRPAIRTVRTSANAVTSAVTSEVVNVNDAPTGPVTITGTLNRPLFAEDSEVGMVLEHQDEFDS